MNNQTNILNVLKWAGGGKQEIQHIKNIDEEKLFDLIDFHRLDTRLLIRLKDERPQWINSKIVDHLEKQNEVAVRDTELKISFMKEYVNLYKSDKKPIAVKGFTNYLLTGEQKYIRRRGDLDLFCHDQELNRKVLENLGFISLVTPSAEYETGNYRPADDKEGIHLDFHKYFPVYQYPEDLNCYDPENDKLPIRQQERIVRQNKIMYEDLLEYSIPCINNINIIKPSMSVLVCSAHLFKTYMKVKRLPVKLSELSDIGDLTYNELFDEKEFDDLVVRFGAFDTIEFVCHLYKCLYHYIPEKLLKYYINMDYKIKRQLPSARIWGYFDKAEDLIVPRNLYEEKIKHQVLQLRADNYIKASIQDEEIGYKSCSFNDSETDIKGVLIDSFNNNLDSCSIGCRIFDDNLNLIINLCTKEVTSIKVDLQMDRDCRQSYQINSEGVLKWQKGVGDLQYNYKENNIQLTSSFSGDIWKGNFLDKKIYAILYIKIIGKEMNKSMSASFPLIIVAQ